MSRRERDAEKARCWQRTIREAVRSGMSIREFCRQHRLREGQFYGWQRRLSPRRPGQRERGLRGPSAGRNQASFALVSDEPGTIDAAIVLVLGDGRRLRILQGVDEKTLRAVLAALEPARCRKALGQGFRQGRYSQESLHPNRKAKVSVAYRSRAAFA